MTSVSEHAKHFRFKVVWFVARSAITRPREFNFDAGLGEKFISGLAGEYRRDKPFEADALSIDGRLRIEYHVTLGLQHGQ
jgi:hypothetical protein